MKKLFFLMIVMLIASPVFGAWDYKITKVEQRADSLDTLTVTVDYTNGVKSITGVEIPVFRPTTKAEVVTAIKNRAATIKDRLQAEASITNTVKPAVDTDINQTAPSGV